jgi:hypothetical protein
MKRGEDNVLMLEGVPGTVPNDPKLHSRIVDLLHGDDIDINFHAPSYTSKNQGCLPRRSLTSPLRGPAPFLISTFIPPFHIIFHVFGASGAVAR